MIATFTGVFGWMGLFLSSWALVGFSPDEQITLRFSGFRLFTLEVFSIFFKPVSVSVIVSETQHLQAVLQKFSSDGFSDEMNAACSEVQREDCNRYNKPNITATKRRQQASRTPGP